MQVPAKPLTGHIVLDDSNHRNSWRPDALMNRFVGKDGGALLSSFGLCLSRCQVWIAACLQHIFKSSPNGIIALESWVFFDA